MSPVDDVVEQEVRGLYVSDTDDATKPTAAQLQVVEEKEETAREWGKEKHLEDPR